MFVKGSKEEAITYESRRRAILPAIYNSNRSKYDWVPDEAYDRAISIQAQQEKQIKVLNSTIEQLKARIVTNDLTDSDVEDMQEILIDDADDDRCDRIANIDEEVEMFLPANTQFPMPIGSMKREEQADNENLLNVLNSHQTPNTHALDENVRSFSHVIFPSIL